jgi:hypothetical protein
MARKRELAHSLANSASEKVGLSWTALHHIGRRFTSERRL